jgi:tetratricopeptide (TPR) repeat protein
MKKSLLLGLALLACVAAGCKDKPKEVPKAVRAEAAQNASEGEFAMQIRDYARAETLFAKSVELDKMVPQYWIQLGAARKRQGNTSGARKAYEEARDICRAEIKRDKNASGFRFIEMEVCLLLGKPDEAKKLLETAKRDLPDDPTMRQFVESNALDRMSADPELKAVGL